MSNKAITLVGDRARSGKSDLLLLVKIADACDDEGRNAWLETPAMARWLRASERGAQYILQRLERTGEIEIEYNDEGREIVLKGGRVFRPKWFIHVRCICEWEAYQHEHKPAKSADSRRGLRLGRPRRKPAKSADSDGAKSRKVCVDKSQLSTPKSAKTGSAYKEGSGNDLVVEQEQAAAPPFSRSQPHPPSADEANLRVLIKTAHDAIDLDGVDASLSQLAATTKSLCRLRRLSFGDHSDLVTRAIDAALWQRRHPREEAV